MTLDLKKLRKEAKRQLATKTEITCVGYPYIILNGEEYLQLLYEVERLTEAKLKCENKVSDEKRDALAEHYGTRDRIHEDIVGAEIDAFCAGYDSRNEEVAKLKKALESVKEVLSKTTNEVSVWQAECNRKEALKIIAELKGVVR